MQCRPKDLRAFIKRQSKPLGVILCLILSGCTFVKDRSQDSVEIVDATYGNSASRKNQIHPTISYKVKKGDTLSSIASKILGNGGRYIEVAKLNNFNPNQPIYAGQRILLPNPRLSKKSVTKRYKRPVVSSSSRSKLVQKPEKNDSAHPELEKLLVQNNYNEAISWLIVNEDLATNNYLQGQLIEASEKQIALYNDAEQYSNAINLVDRLASNNQLTPDTKEQLSTNRSKIVSRLHSTQAANFWKDNNSEKAYQQLLAAYQKNSNTAEKFTPFVTTRSLVSEKMHQQALKYYRNQQLKEALTIWNNILDIKPNDDLALVYKNRVVSLQQKLKDF